MVMEDFEYNGITLSSLGYIIGYFSGNASQDTPLGSVLTVNTIRNKSNNSTEITDVSYEENIKAQFDIIKNNCVSSEEYFSEEEIRYIMRWLNRKEYKKFVPIYDEEMKQSIYYWGNFPTINAVEINNKVVGFSLTFESNAPYGWVDNEVEFKNVDSFVFYDNSDEIGYMYPKEVRIKNLEKNELLTISNSFDKNNEIKIYNLEQDETIEMDSIHKLISTDNENHELLYNDFNYKYFRTKNTFENNINEFSLSSKCDISFKYTLSRKVGIFV